MTLFYVVAALLAVLTLVLLTRPWWQRRLTGANAGRGADSAAIADLKRQLQQLVALHKEGALDDAPFNEAKAGLERRLVDTVLAEPAPAPADARPAAAPLRLLLVLAAFVVGVAAVGYGWIGSPQALTPGTVERPAASDAAGTEGHSVSAEQIDAMTGKLAARLKSQPDDVEGWAMLGRSYAVLGRHDEAAKALKQAIAQRPDDAVLLADYADALAAGNNRSLEGEPSRLVARALEIEPENIKALSLAGTAAFNRKDYAGALRHWEKLVKVAPDSELATQIQGGVDEARKLAGTGVSSSAAPPPAAAASPAVSAAGASVRGVVTLSAALAAKAAPEDTVFVFARAAQGSRMPLAILRKQVKDLPLNFVLDDSLAMSPAARLSSALQVVVGARISKSGQAIAQPGDLQALSEPVAVGATGLRLDINEAVKP